MNGKALKSKRRIARALSLVAPSMLIIGSAGFTPAIGATPGLPAEFRGMLNDYTPSTVVGGPYEMHGKWSLKLNQQRSTASFSAEMTMETADFANPDAVAHDPTKLGPHSHHIKVSDGVIHDDPTDSITWTNSCPTLKPAAAGGFVVTGSAYVAGNGSNAPFGNPSLVTLCILGGARNPTVTGTQAVVEFSNFTMTFNSTSLASTHFGAQAINGVIDGCDEQNLQTHPCKITLED